MRRLLLAGALVLLSCGGASHEDPNACDGHPQGTERCMSGSGIPYTWIEACSRGEWNFAERCNELGGLYCAPCSSGPRCVPHGDMDNCP